MKKNTRVFWVGFTDGKLYFSLDYPFYDHACLYKTKKQALNSFEDVRPVRLVYVKRKKTAKRTGT